MLRLNIKLYTFILLVSLPLITGCAFLGYYEKGTPKEKIVFKVADTTHAMQPIYGTHRTVLPPYVNPSRDLPESDAKFYPRYRIKPQAGSTVEQATETLAATMGYRYYCSSLVAERKISLDKTGTIQQLIEELESKGHVRVVIDEELKDIRVFDRDPVRAKLPQ